MTARSLLRPARRIARWLRVGIAAIVVACPALGGCLEGDPNPLARDDDPDQSSSGGGAPSQPAPAPTAQPSSASSKDGPQPVNLPFRNGFTDRSVRIFWVDYGCNEVAYNVLEPGQSHVQQTYVGQPWRVRDAATNALYREVVATSTAPPEVVVP